MNEIARKKLESMLHRQITLGVESIFSAVYSGPSLRTLSFTHVLNRVMMLVQLPITFVVMKRDESGGYSEYFRTNHHRRHIEIIDKAKDNADPRNYFPLWHSSDEFEKNNFALLVLKADKSYNFEQLLVVDSVSSKMNFWDVGSYKLSQIFKKDNYGHYQGFVDRILMTVDNTGANIKSSSDGDDQVVGRNINLSDDERLNFFDQFKSEFDRNLLSNMGLSEYTDLRKWGVLDKVFKKIKKNITDVNSESTSREYGLTNFLLFARDYHDFPRDKLRHGCYDYSLRILLCDSQKEEIKKKFFAGLKKQKGIYRNRYADELSGIDGGVKKLAMEIDEYFWSVLESGEAGEERLIDLLGEYFGVGVRSMADPVFDGLSFYRQPFANDGGIARCFSPGVSRPDTIQELLPNTEELNDLLRVICCQYLFDYMATPGKAGNGTKLQLQVMLNPVEIGGRVWGVVAYATRSHNPNTYIKQEDDIRLYESYWTKNYHIYRDVNERMKKNLRSYMNSFYENFVARIYVRVMEKISSDQAQVHRRLVDIENGLNRQLGLLACVFPYDVVKVEFRKDKDLYPVPSSRGPELECRAMAGRRWAAYVRAEGQEMFPVTPGVSPSSTSAFVDTKDVAVAMTDMLLREAVVS
ncbi:hypothetical protein [Hydrogenophaga sp. RWCD_12]|uniref:hypothetical protein n=1 Tax=Hydrogenophaga sp. RWCD_12 TaxID=3391190 RepID=UPI003984B5B9